MMDELRRAYVLVEDHRDPRNLVAVFTDLDELNDAENIARTG